MSDEINLAVPPWAYNRENRATREEWLKAIAAGPIIAVRLDRKIRDRLRLWLYWLCVADKPAAKEVVKDWDPKDPGHVVLHGHQYMHLGPLGSVLWTMSRLHGDLWNHACNAMCYQIFSDPFDPLPYGLLADLLEELGCTCQRTFEWLRGDMRYLEAYSAAKGNLDPDLKME